MIDLHCHILPGIDDGPRDIRESVAMCRIAASDGIEAIVATPHMLKDIYQFTNKDIVAKVAELNEALVREAVPLTILPGAEVAAITPDIPEFLLSNTIMTVNNRKRHVFLELTEVFPEDAIMTLLKEIRACGITPVIVHPERNEQIQKDTGLLEKFISLGALSQLTGMSITGDFGSRTRKVSQKLLKKGLAHIIASDAHSSKWRPPLLSEAVSEAAKIVGAAAARAMVNDLPHHLINGSTGSNL